MRRLVFIFLLLPFIGLAQSNSTFRTMLKQPAPPPSGGLVPFSFTEYAYSNPDLMNPGRGAEQWHNGSESINNPTPNSLVRPFDVYYRFEWARIEGATQGSYNFSYFDGLIRSAINAGQQFSFGIMTYYSDAGFVTYDGAQSSYPLYLHNLMQSAPNAADRDFITPFGNWMPNWNSPHYLGRLRALHVALNNHIMTTSYTATAGPRQGQSIRYQDVIHCIDIRGFGNYGEWHSGEMYNFGAFPGNTQPTAASLIEIINTHTEVFQNWPLGMMVAGYNGTGGASYIPIFHTYNSVGYYALTATNSWGQVGNRRDQFGATDNYLNDLLQNNNTVVNGQRFGTLYLNLYKTSPGTGEAMPGVAASNQMVQLEQQVINLGATSFGNGNWGSFPNAVTQDRIRAAWKRSGYRIKITNGEAPTIITRGVQFQIKINWQNIGVTPAYNDWQVVYELQTGGGTVVWTGVSSKVLKLFRPDQGVVETTDNFIVTLSTSAGAYKLVVRVKDPLEFRPDMKLAINGVNGDGSYTIFNEVTVN